MQYIHVAIIHGRYECAGASTCGGGSQVWICIPLHIISPLDEGKFCVMMKENVCEQDVG